MLFLSYLLKSKKHWQHHAGFKVEKIIELLFPKSKRGNKTITLTNVATWQKDLTGLGVTNWMDYITNEAEDENTIGESFAAAIKKRNEAKAKKATN